LRGGITVALIPFENVKDLAEIPENVKQGIEIIPVRWIEEVLVHALEKPLTPIVEPEVAVDLSKAVVEAKPAEGLSH
jgi:ATP-dependent Lon protease